MPNNVPRDIADWLGGPQEVPQAIPADSIPCTGEAEVVVRGYKLIEPVQDPLAGGWFVCRYVELPGVVARAKTREEARELARELAIAGVASVLAKGLQPPPAGPLERLVTMSFRVTRAEADWIQGQVALTSSRNQSEFIRERVLAGCTAANSARA